MFNFLDYTKNKIDYIGFKKLPNSGVFKVKLRSVKKKNFLKKNKKKVFKKCLPNFKKLNTFVQNNLSRSDIFLVRSFIWFKFRSLQKYILKKKSLKRKRRRLITQRVLLKQGSFKLKRFSSYSYLRSILKR